MSNCPECDKILFSNARWCKCGWKLVPDKKNSRGEVVAPNPDAEWNHKLRLLDYDYQGAKSRKEIYESSKEPWAVAELSHWRSVEKAAYEKIMQHLASKQEWRLQA